MRTMLLLVFLAHVPAAAAADFELVGGGPCYNGAWRQYSGYWFYGNDLSMTVDDCKDICESLDWCIAFNYRSSPTWGCRVMWYWVEGQRKLMPYDSTVLEPYGTYRIERNCYESSDAYDDDTCRGGSQGHVNGCGNCDAADPPTQVDANYDKWPCFKRLLPPVPPTYEQLPTIDWAAYSVEDRCSTNAGDCSNRCIPPADACITGQGVGTTMLWVKMTIDTSNGYRDSPLAMGYAKSGTCNGWSFAFRKSGGYSGDSLQSHYCDTGVGGGSHIGNTHFDTWIHYAIVQDQGSVKVYRDGELVEDTSANWNSDCTGDCPVSYGSTQNQPTWGGETKDLRIFKGHALRRDEIVHWMDTPGVVTTCVRMAFGAPAQVCEESGYQRVTSVEQCNLCAERFQCDAESLHPCPGGYGTCATELEPGWCTGTKYGSEYAHHFQTNCGQMGPEIRYNPMCEDDRDGMSSGNCQGPGSIQVDHVAPICLAVVITGAQTSTTTVTTGTVTTDTTSASTVTSTRTATTVSGTATTMTSATTTTVSSTTTATTSTTPEVTCSPSRLFCPLPADLAAGTYVLEGNETAPPGPCRMQGSGTRRFFDVVAEECNMTSTEVPGGVNLSVTLVPAAGVLIFASDPLPTLVCSCFYDTQAEVGTAVTVDIPKASQTIDGQTGSFNASMRLYADDSYDQPVSPGEEFPAASSRFFFEVTMDSTGDVIGIPNCTVAPTAEDDDEFQVDLRSKYCYEPMFDAIQISGPGVDSETTRVRWSITKFKFSGFGKVHISCRVVRCASAPCGTCGGRRLGEGRQLQETTAEQGTSALTTLDFVLPPGEYLVLPGVGPEVEAGAALGTNASSMPTQAASETPDTAIIAVVATAAVLIIAVAAISVFVMRRLKKRGKGSPLGAAEDASIADAAVEEGTAKAVLEAAGADAPEAMEQGPADTDEAHEKVMASDPSDGVVKEVLTIDAGGPAHVAI